MFKIILFILVIVLSYGCATNKPYLAQNNIQLDSSSDYGLVVLSVNLAGASKGLKYIINSDNDEVYIRVPEYGIWEESTPMLQSDFEEDIAKLVVLKLNAGKYKFTEWYTSYANQYGTYETNSKQDFPIYFDVTASAVTYIGELYQVNEHSGFSIINSKVNIADSSERDLSLFLQKYPNIRKEQITEKLAYRNKEAD